jgi:TnpA family transposase
MTAIDRTAYPNLDKALTREELAARHTLSEADREFISINTRGVAGRLMLAILLSVRRDVGYFPTPGETHASVISHIAAQLELEVTERRPDFSEKTLYRYRAAVRDFLDIHAYGREGEGLVSAAIINAAATMSDPADLINRALEALAAASIDLPAFSTLDRLAGNLRAQAHRQMYGAVAARLYPAAIVSLDALLIVSTGSVTTAFNRLKHSPGPLRPKTIKKWTERLDWLTGLIDPDLPLEGITHTKLRQFAAEAAAMEVSDLLDVSLHGKRYTLLLSLIRQARAKCRDELVEMLLRKVRGTQAAARKKLKELQESQRDVEEKLIAVLLKTLHATGAEEPDAAVGHQVRSVFAQLGGVETLVEQCETVSAVHHNNDLQLLWPIHARTRSLLFNMIEMMDIRSATRDISLLDALETVIAHRNARRGELKDEVNLGFASQRWQNFVIKRRAGRDFADRRAFEVCVFIHLAAALQSGDLYVVGAESFDDYRSQLLPWADCLPRLADYCLAVGMPEESGAFVADLKAELTQVAAEVDDGFPGNTELMFDAVGSPRLKQIPRQFEPEGLVAFETEVHNRMDERHLLDILKNGVCWTSYTRHFGPPSGANPKLPNAEQRYILTVFGYGCNLGPGQTARHTPDIASAGALRRINAQHIDVHKLEAASTDLINAYNRFTLPRLWGTGSAAIADGTHIPLRKNNLLGAQHIRYGGYGGIAYHHISDSYIALFTTFIPCGVWEAVHILDGLIQNRSAVQPDTLHADTQGQSEPVFGLARLLAIKLMPRMRNWDDVTFYRADKTLRYSHIDSLFTREIDWKLIETHWQDMMQVVLSIQAGLVLPSMLLRKLGSYNRKNLLGLAFRELGRVERTLFLLQYISQPQTRQTIRAATTKIESFNDFLDWITFGSPVIKSGDPVEQEKQLKYASLIANAIMLSNVADLSAAMTDMASDGHLVTPELAEAISPYIRKHIHRFGKYSLNMDDRPGPLEARDLPFKIPL